MAKMMSQDIIKALVVVYDLFTLYGKNAQTRKKIIKFALFSIYELKRKKKATTTIVLIRIITNNKRQKVTRSNAQKILTHTYIYT